VLIYFIIILPLVVPTRRKILIEMLVNSNVYLLEHSLVHFIGCLISQESSSDMNACGAIGGEREKKKKKEEERKEKGKKGAREF
jgi:hypothetical protein